MREKKPLPLSKHDVIPGAYDQDDKLVPTVVSAPMGVEIILRGNDRSPVELDLEPQVIEEWMSPVIDSMYGNRAMTLVSSLGLYDGSERLLRADSIVERINYGMRIDLQLKDTLGNDLFVLDLFDGDELAARYTLWMGLYRSVFSVLSSEDVNDDVAAEFSTAAQQLGISPDHYTHSLEQVNDSELLHQWMFPDGSILSIHHELQVLLLGQAERLDVEPLLDMASIALLYPDTHEEMEAAGLLPKGEMTFSPSPTELTLEDRQFAVANLRDNPVAHVHFIMHILSERSKLYLLQWVRYILSKPNSNGYFGTQ